LPPGLSRALHRRLHGHGQQAIGRGRGADAVNAVLDKLMNWSFAIAFHPDHIVFGIDFINDPVVQGGLFSYTDTHLIRPGGPNSHEIAINRSLAPVQNNNLAAIRCKQKKAWAASSLPAIIAL
jgi:hypothetical protein